MTDLQWLLAILALLYLWECACWTRRGSVAFRTWLGKRWSIRHPGALLGNQHGGFVFAHPLPPLGTFLTAAQIPFSVGPEGLLVFVSSSVNPGGRPPQIGQFYPWSEVQEIRAAGKKLTVNGKSVLLPGSEVLAQFFEEELEAVRNSPGSSRETRITKLARSILDWRAIEKRLEFLEQKGRRLSILANGLWVFVFCVAPLVIWRAGFLNTWPILLGCLFAATLALALLFRRAHRDLYPRASDERFTNFLIVLLSPATSMRAGDLLSRRVVEHFHPLAVTKALCSAGDFEKYAKLIWRESCHPAHPVCPNPNPTAAATEQYWRKTLITEIERFLKASGLAPNILSQPPTRQDPSCVAYCPRCEAQYTTLEAVCRDCGGLKVEAFAAPETALK